MLILKVCNFVPFKFRSEIFSMNFNIFITDFTGLVENSVSLVSQSQLRKTFLKNLFTHHFA